MSWGGAGCMGWESWPAPVRSFMESSNVGSIHIFSHQHVLLMEEGRTLFLELGGRCMHRCMTQRHLCHHFFTLSGHSTSQRAHCLPPPGVVVHSDHYPRDWPLWGLSFVSRNGPLGVLSWGRSCQSMPNSVYLWTWVPGAHGGRPALLSLH